MIFPFCHICGPLTLIYVGCCACCLAGEALCSANRCDCAASFNHDVLSSSRFALLASLCTRPPFGDTHWLENSCKLDRRTDVGPDEENNFHAQAGVARLLPQSLA